MKGIRWTSDARRALQSVAGTSTLPNRAASRRDFLKTAGVLVVGFQFTGGNSARGQALPNAVSDSPSLSEVDSWLAIAADGSITAYSGKEELGQGISTAQQQLVAEELQVPFERVKLIYCDTALTPDQAHTSGSQSHPANFNESNLAQACATAREAIYMMASESLSAPVNRLTAWDGVITVKGDTSKKVTYAELIGGQKFMLGLSSTAQRIPATEWKVLGQPIKRIDMPDIATGRFEFVHNVRLPGMLHGRVVRPPTVGATVASVDESSVAGMPGLVKVVVKKNFVGVVAQKQAQAIQAAARLKVTWTPGPALPSYADFYETMRKQPSRDVMLVDSKDSASKLSQAATVLKTTYYHPYQMHGSVGSSCSVADVQGEKATIYSATQGVWYQKHTSAMVLGLKPENIHVIFRRGSGCYGLNGADTVTYDAAMLSQAVGKPVRVQLSRKDEMAWENYGFAYVIEERAGLDDKGNIIAWEHESWTPGRGNRPGVGLPGNVVTGYLLGFQSPRFSPGPAADPRSYSNNTNGIPSYVTGTVAGKAHGTGRVAAEKVLVHNVESPFFTGPLRSPNRLQNTFAHESFMDELAAHAKADPVEFRLRHLKDPRLIAVVKAAANEAKWDARPSPKPGQPRTGVVTGRGISCVLYEGDNGYSAAVVEVEVNQDNGQVTVKNIFTSHDCGPISNPDGLRNQIEGGALQAMSRALGEEVTWDREKITSFDWRTYKSLPVGIAIPNIQSILINRPDEEATGAGETSITVIAGAIANAIFDATGARVRQIPFTADWVKQALDKRPA